MENPPEQIMPAISFSKINKTCKWTMNDFFMANGISFIQGVEAPNYDITIDPEFIRGLRVVRDFVVNDVCCKVSSISPINAFIRMRQLAGSSSTLSWLKQ